MELEDYDTRDGKRVWLTESEGDRLVDAADGTEQPPAPRTPAQSSDHAPGPGAVVDRERITQKVMSGLHAAPEKGLAVLLASCIDPRQMSTF